jgi:Sec7-like guanine-nucleotide exchange factor
MSVEDYQKNLRGVNDGADFSPEYLVRSSDREVYLIL